MDVIIIYLLGTLLSTYTIYRCLQIFYADSGRYKLEEFCAYEALNAPEKFERSLGSRRISLSAHFAGFARSASYFIYLACVLAFHFLGKSPMALLIAVLTAVFILGALLRNGLVRKGRTALLLLMLVESAVILADGYAFPTFLGKDAHDPVFNLYGEMLIRALAALALVIIYLIKAFFTRKDATPSAAQDNRKRQGLPTKSNLWLIIIPALAIAAALMILKLIKAGSQEEMRSTYMLASFILAVLSAISILTFYIPRLLEKSALKRSNQLVDDARLALYEKQVMLMQDYLNNMSMLRHDLKNKLSPLYGLAESGKNKELLEELENLTSFCGNKDYINTGNSAIDSIINFKLDSANKKGIEVNSNILIPKNLAIAAFDAAAILGNLLDNAIEAAEKTEKPTLKLSMKYVKGSLIIEVTNSYAGSLVPDSGDGSFKTTKTDGAQHGIGLKSVRETLNKYDGTIQFYSKKDSYVSRFTAKAVLYVL